MSEFEFEWGCGRKRVNSEVSCEEFVEHTMGTIKKKKIEHVHPLIYTTGNEVHFSYDHIDKPSIELFIKQLTRLVEKKYKGKKTEDPVTITYVLDTPGGCVTSALKFVDFISLIKEKYPNLKFVSVITGLVASAGTIMAIVADKRYITANAHAMIHELSTGNQGRYTQLVAHGKFIIELQNKLTTLYMKHVDTMSREELEGLLMKDAWYGAEEYLEKGFVHEIKG